MRQTNKHPVCGTSTLPLAIRGNGFGALLVTRAAGGRPFRMSDVGLVEANAVHSAVALEYERVRQQLRPGTRAA
jgi:GAF domain-containing protein